MQDNQRWVGFKHVNGKYYLLRENKVFDAVGPNEALMVSCVGYEPWKMLQFMHDRGETPDTKDVHEYILKGGQVGRPSKPIRCVETGQIFPSINAAAQELGIPQGNLSKHLKYPQVFHTIKGYKFAYHHHINTGVTR